MGKRLTIGSRAVAVAVLTEALRDASQLGDDVQLSGEACRLIADHMVRQAWDVEYRPNAEKLILTISAGMEVPDRMRSTPEVHPAPSGVDSIEAGCAYISNGVQCALLDGHAGQHDVG